MSEMNIEPVFISDDLLEKKEWYIVLQKLIWDLPERNRNVILMKYYGDMTSKEIGNNLDISSGNVRIILKRTLSTLKSKLNTEFTY